MTIALTRPALTRLALSLRNVNGNVQLQVDTVHGCHVVQYERKLLSLEARERRQRHLTHRSAAGKKRLGRPDVLCFGSENSFFFLKQRRFSPLSLSCLFSKVQARIAFSSYLQRVQQRLLAESRANTIPAWPDKDSDQMELVIRFLRRAASNLQQDIKVVLPSRQLPLQDRRRILSHQLGEFIHCYNKETEHMVQKQENSKEEHCVNSRVFQEYITVASENDLEEVLTFYTQKNKSATVFLGTEVRSASESQPSVRMLPEDRQAEVRTGKTQPDVQSSQHCSSFPVTLDCMHISLQHCPPAPASLPLHCPPPPPPPQPPSYAQSLAKSHFCHSETLSDPPAYTSAPVITQPSRIMGTASSAGSTGPSTQVLRRIQSFTLSHPAASSIPSATHIYSQKLSRPTSASQGNPILKSNSTGAFRELNSLSAQAQSNQQAFISALQKLADKQVARHCASSSHINLLTQHLTNLNLANRMLGRESFTLNPKAFTTQGPVRAVHSGTDLHSSTSHRPLKDEEGLWDGQMESAYSLVTGVNPKQRYQPTQGSYQLQFAIQQLQQQRQKSHQFLEQSHCRHQAQFPDQTSAPHTQAPTKSSSCPPSGFHVRPNHGHGHSHIQTCVSPALAPKPPSSAREGHTRKTATKRLIK
uniref:Tubulin tyrosine ligase-like family, member 5 n=1 Tax=Stegastes partitus TaxID=144197 RepID=A0A3B4ZU45_9TELE